MLNILFIASFPIDPERGGVQRVTHTLTEEFLRRGIKVYYLSLEDKPNSYPYIADQFILPNSKDLWSPENVIFSKNLMKEKQVNVIINQTGVYKTKMNFIAKIKPRTTKLITVHHNCLICLNKNYRNIRLSNANKKSIFKVLDYPIFWMILKRLNRIKQGKLFKNAIRKSDQLVLLSEKYIPELKYFLSSFDEKKIAGIPNPASFKTPDDLSYDRKDSRLLFVGRLTINQKRVERLLIIWEKLYKKYPTWQFDILGDGDARAFLQSEISKRNLKRIKLHGHQDPRPFLKKAKIFTLTSDFEGYGMVLVEAQAYGVVPVAFNCFSALEEIIENNQTGLIVKENDIEAYVKQLESLMKNDKKLQNMSEKSKKAPINYEVSHIAQHWYKLIDRLNE